MGKENLIIAQNVKFKELNQTSYNNYFFWNLFLNNYSIQYIHY